MDLGVQGLEPAVEHFGKAGVVADLRHRHAVLRQQLRRTAGGEDLDAEFPEALGELDDTGFVRDAD